LTLKGFNKESFDKPIGVCKTIETFIKNLITKMKTQNAKFVERVALSGCDFSGSVTYANLLKLIKLNLSEEVEMDYSKSILKSEIKMRESTGKKLEFKFLKFSPFTVMKEKPEYPEKSQKEDDNIEGALEINMPNSENKESPK